MISLSDEIRRGTLGSGVETQMSVRPLKKPGEQYESSKPDEQCHYETNSMKMPDQQQCVRDGKRWCCSNMALPGSIYCEKHHFERDAYNKKRRKGPQRENCYVTHLPSGELRCRKTRKRWQCLEKATTGLYCDKHGLKEDIRNKNRRKGDGRPSRTLMALLSVGEGQPKYSGNGGSNSDQLTGLKLTREENRASNIEDVITNPNSNDGVKQVSAGPVESGELTMQQRCHRGGKRWDRLEMASPGKLYCDRHQLERDAYNKMRRKGPKRQGPGDGQCRRAGKGWRCKEIASPGIYCETHQLERDSYNEQRRKRPKRKNKIEDVRGSNIRDALSKPNSNDCGKEVSSGPVKPGREATKRQSVRKRLRDKEIISADLGSGLGEMAMKKCRGVSVNNEHEESGWVGKQTTASPDNRPTSEPNMEIASPEATMKFQEAQGRLSVTNCYMAFDEHTSTYEEVHVEKTSEVIEEDIEGTHDHVDIGKYNQIEGIGPDNIAITCVDSPRKCQKSQNLSHEDKLQNAIEDEQKDIVMLSLWSDYNSYEELQENEGLSFVTDGAMNAVDFSTVYVGDILIPAEYEQIYKEIKDLHGPLENGEAVGEKRSLSHATLVELLKVAHELEGLTMDSMTETTISNFERTIAIGKLFNYNVGWLDENLKRLGDLYVKHCAVDVGSLEQDVQTCNTLLEATHEESSQMEEDAQSLSLSLLSSEGSYSPANTKDKRAQLGGELKQVERKIIEEKHEEDILKFEFDKVNEAIGDLEESINKMMQKREMIEMEKKNKYSNISVLLERSRETSERICDTTMEFYSLAAGMW